MGIPDEESYFRRSYLPTGRATGWRRRVLIVIVGAAAAAVVAVAAVAMTDGSDPEQPARHVSPVPGTTVVDAARADAYAAEAAEVATELERENERGRELLANAERSS